MIGALVSAHHKADECQHRDHSAIFEQGIVHSRGASAEARAHRMSVGVAALTRRQRAGVRVRGLDGKDRMANQRYR